MQYSLKEVKLVGKPGNRKFQSADENGKPIVVEKYGITVVVVTQIVGQIYKGFCNNDSVFYELDKDETINENDTNLNAFATQFVQEKYPNTP